MLDTNTTRADVLVSIATRAARNDLIALNGDSGKINSVRRMVAIAAEANISPETGETDFYRLRTAGKLPAGRLSRRAQTIAWKLYVITRAVA